MRPLRSVYAGELPGGRNRERFMTKIVANCRYLATETPQLLTSACKYTLTPALYSALGATYGCRHTTQVACLQDANFHLSHFLFSTRAMPWFFLPASLAQRPFIPGNFWPSVASYALPPVWSKQPAKLPHQRCPRICRRQLHRRPFHPAPERPRITTRSGLHTTRAAACTRWSVCSDLLASIPKDENRIFLLFMTPWGDRPTSLQHCPWIFGNGRGCFDPRFLPTC